MKLICKSSLERFKISSVSKWGRNPISEHEINQFVYCQNAILVWNSIRKNH